MSAEFVELPARDAHVWRFPWSIAFLMGVLGLISLWLFWDGLVYMWAAWTQAPEYSHAILIPPIAGFLLWQQRDRLERIPFTGSWWGAALVLLGGGLLLLGQFATIYTLVQYAYLVTLCGLVLAFTGRAAFRWVALPLSILVFMIPLPQFVLINLSTKLQLWSSDLGVALMRLAGISVYVEGNVIDLGGYKLQVAEACSGLRYLFPLMTLGFLVAYFYRGAPWKRVVVVLSSIPITLVMNSVRVGTIGFMVEHWGIRMAEGFLHEFQGWAVFMVCIGLMLGETALLHAIGDEAGTLRQSLGVEWPAPSPRGAVRQARRVPPPFIAAGLLLLAFVAAALGVPRPVEVTPGRTGLTEFPMHMPGWTGRPDTLEGVYLDTLKLDDYLLADYSSAQGAHLNLYIAYYNSQRKGEAVHSPRSCLPGGGWRLRQFDQRIIPEVLFHGRALRVNRTSIELGNQRELVYYWFQQRGRVVTNEFAVKWYLFWDAVTRQRTDGALVRLITAVPAGGNEREADRLLSEFAARIVPTLPRYIPD